ncbi:DUF6236 family protein [Vibrio splendidus]
MFNKGIVVSPPFEVDFRGGLSCGGSPDPLELRKYLTYWDEIDYPSNNFIFITSDDIEYLSTTHALKRTHINFQGRMSTDNGNIFIWAQDIALQENSQIEPGCWSLGQVSTTPYYAKQHKGTGIELELFNLLPVPNVDTPLADILEFKEKRNDELVAFRCYLDEINEKILSSIDVPRAKNAELNRLELSLKDIDRTMSESGIGKVVSNFKHVINTDLSGIIGVGLGAAGLASFVPMSPMVAGLSSAGIVTTVRSLMVSNHSKYGDLTYLKSVRQCF